MPSTTDILLPLDPAPLVLDRVAQILRQGFPDIPDFPASPPWDDSRAGDTAPAAHWLLPEGCPILRGDVPDEAPPVSCLVYQADPSMSEPQRRRLYWLVPVDVEIRLDRALQLDLIRDLAQLLQFALCEDFIGCPARHRLSTARLRVRDIRDIHTTLPALSGEWEPVIGVSFTLFCSAIDCPPPDELF